MTSDAFFRRSMKIAVPVALQAMLQSSFSMIDQLMVGQLGKTAIASVEIGSKPGFIFTFVSGAVATTTGIMISQYIGKKENDKVDVSMSVNLFVMMAISLFTTLMCFFIPGNLAGIFTEDTAVIDSAGRYIRIISLVYPLSGAATVLAVHIRCMNHSEYPLFASGAAAVINTVLNFLLIFGHCGFPEMGVAGAAIASVISQLVNLIIMIWLYRKVCHFNFDMHMTGTEWKQYIIMLTPLIMNELLWTIGQNVNTFIYGHMGTGELAGMSLTGPVQGLFIGCLSGISQAAGILIGERLGEKEYNKAYVESKKLCKYGFIGSIILSIILLLIGKHYINLYNVESDVNQIGTQLLMIFAILAPIKVQNMILGGGIIRSGGRTTYIMIIDLLGTWLVGVPLGLFAGLYLKLSIVWTYFILSQEELIRLIITIYVFRSKKWMNTIK